MKRSETDDLELAGRRVFLAGATGLVGGELAARFAAAGCNLILHSNRGFAEAECLAEELAVKYTIDAKAVQADLRDDVTMAMIRGQLLARGATSIDVVVNCVTGFDGTASAVGQLSTEEFRRVVDVDLVGSFALVRELLPLLLKGDAPRVVLMSSLAGIRGRPGAAHLCAAKAGVIGLALALARELAAERVPVNCVAPGPILRPQPDSAAASAATHQTLGPGVALSTPNDVASVVLYLASAMSGVFTGQVISVNGGQP